MDRSATFLQLLLLGLLLVAVPASAGVITFGTVDCLTNNCYGANDPTAGTTLLGLAPGASTSASISFGHGFPFTPSAGDFPGTDQIYVGSTQTGAHDGYSVYAGRLNAPLVLTLDYSSAIPAGQSLQTLTLGLALDDFQFAVFGQPFSIAINGAPDATIGAFINGLDQSGPVVQFFTFGLSTSVDNGSHVLTISIDEGGDGGDGFAVDFATVGVTTAPTSSVPEPSAPALIAVSLAGLALRSARRAPTWPR
jgi:hypothetical protein